MKWHMLYINWNLSISVTFLFQNREKCGHVHNNLTVVLDHSFSHPLWCESGINLVCDIFCWYWTWQRMFSQLFNMWTCKNLKYIFDEQTWRIYSYHCLNCDCSNVCWVETNVNRNQTYFNHYKSRIWESLWSAAWLWYCANITIRGI